METREINRSQDLISRYVYAVVRALPRGQREDISRELHTLIADMLEERCGEITPTERDVRVVLTELGTPGELAAQYDPRGERCLIPPPYYRTYAFLLKLVIAAAAGGITLSQILLFFIDSPGWGSALLRWIGLLATGLCFAFTFVTLLFAVFSRRGVPIQEWGASLDDLPPVPQKEEIPSKGESVCGIVFAVLFAVLFLFFPQVFRVLPGSGEAAIPVFSAAALQRTWPLILGIAVLTVAYEGFSLFEGRYTRRLAVVNSVSNLLVAVLASLWLAGRELFTPAFVEYVRNSPDWDLPAAKEAVLNSPYILLGILLFAVVLDTAVTWWKAWRYDRLPRSSRG